MRVKEYIIADVGKEDEAREWLRADVARRFPGVPFDIVTAVLSKSSFAGRTVHWAVNI